MNIAEQKQTLRREALARRAEIRAAHPGIDSGVATRFLSEVPIFPGAAISAYAAIGDEADPAPAIAALRQRGHPILLPRVRRKGQPLAFHLYPQDGSLNQANFGLLEPPADWDETVPDVMMVPLLAFDASGHRLGYGAGFYDRTLEALRRSHKVLAVGYAFAGQEIARVPAHDGDRKLDWVVTEQGARKFTD